MAFLGLKTEEIRYFISAKKTLVFIFLVILPLTYLFIIIYFYVFNIKAAPLEQNKEISVDQKLYGKAMENLRQRELNFSEEADKTYIDPFGR